MLQIISQPLLLGFSSGLYCLSYCAPFFAPFLVSEKRSFKKNLFLFLKFILGRFLGYLIFGTVFGFLGATFNTAKINLFANISLLLMSILLILYALNVTRISGKSFCLIKISSSRFPFFLGLISGISLCPPFILALNLVFAFHNIIGGVVFFALFFIGTTIYLIPLLILTPLGLISQVRSLARFAAFTVGVIYFIYEIFFLYRGFFVFKTF